MILAVNIGNTNISFGLQTDTQIVCYRIVTQECSSSLQIKRGLKTFLNNQGILLQHISGCIISSVVPEKSLLLLETIRNYLKVNPIFVTSMMDFNINLSLYDCSLIGTDRLLCCMKSYASYKLPFVVYDLGTATTANIVNENGYFLGGAILPGIDTGLMSLNKNTAMLPKAVPSSNIPLIGKNTNECLLSGVIYSTASFIDNYTNEINKELGNIATVIITGGNASKIIPFLKTDVIYCPDLLLEGLFLLYPKLKKEGFHENKK